MKFFRHTCLYPFVDYVLTSKEKQADLHETLQSKCIVYTDPPKEVVEKLKKAAVLYVYPDSFDQWTDILLFLHQKSPLPVKLMIFADSDIAFANMHMDALFAFFDKTEFWIQNWTGYHERATLLPLGMSDTLPELESQKESPLGISFLNHYIGCKARDNFFAFLHSHQEILPYCFPKTGFQDYCQRVSKCAYHTCPMGEGYDTYRFWESLALGTIPVVVNDLFYESLDYHYPTIPMLQLENWDELPSLLPTLQAQTIPELPYLYESYWVSKLKEVLH